MSEPSYFRHPVEDIEPDESHADYRECAQKMVFILNRAMLWVLQARHSQVAFWQACFAIGLPICQGRTMTSVAKELGVGRAAISKGAKQFQRMNNLPTNSYMKDETAIPSYSKARKDQL